MLRVEHHGATSNALEKCADKARAWRGAHQLDPVVKPPCVVKLKAMVLKHRHLALNHGHGMFRKQCSSEDEVVIQAA